MVSLFRRGAPSFVPHIIKLLCVAVTCIHRTAGWRDIVINGVLEDDFVNNHVVEIQLHYEPFVLVRENLGGHFIYAKQRALQEAFEVVFGDEARGQAEVEAKAEAEVAAKAEAKAKAEAAAKAAAEAKAKAVQECFAKCTLLWCSILSHHRIH